MEIIQLHVRAVRIVGQYSIIFSVVYPDKKYLRAIYFAYHIIM